MNNIQRLRFKIFKEIYKNFIGFPKSIIEQLEIVENYILGDENKVKSKEPIQNIINVSCACGVKFDILNKDIIKKRYSEVTIYCPICKAMCVYLSFNELKDFSSDREASNKAFNKAFEQNAVMTSEDFRENEGKFHGE